MTRLSPSRLLTGALVALFALALATPLAPGLARAAYLGVAHDQLRLDELQPGAPLASAECTLCHVKPTGGAPWNPFGLAVGKQKAKSRKVDVATALYEALKLEADVDEDGYPDALEIFAGTLPGDAKSKPTESLESLQTRFIAAGGIDRYAPKKR